MQTTLLGLAIAIILALVTALVGPLFVDWDQYRTVFEAQASRLVGMPVRVRGPIEVRLLPTPSLQLRAIELGRPGEQNGVRAQKLGFEFALGALLRGQFRVSETHLVGPEINVALDRSGRVDWPAITIGFDPDAVAIEHLSIEDGRVVLSDAASGSRAVLDKLWFTGSVQSLAGPFRGEGAFINHGEPYGYRVTAGRIGDDGGLHLRFGLDPSDRLTMDADGTLFWQNGMPRFEGSLAVARPAGLARASGQMLLNEPWRVNARVRATPAAALFEQAEFQYGSEERGFKLTGTAELKFGAEPRFHGVVTGRQIDLDRAIALPDVTARPPLASIQAIASTFAGGLRPPMPIEVGLSIDALTLGGSDLQSVRTDLRVEGDSWNIGRLEFRAPGFAQVQASGRLDFTAAGIGSFTGPVSIDAGNPRVFAAWLEGRSDGGQSPPQSLHARGEVTAASDRLQIERMKIEYEHQAVEGRLAYVFATHDRPARLDADLRADELDLDQTLALAKGALASARLDRPQEIALALAVGHATIAGLDVRQAEARLRLDGKGIAVERLAVADFGGAAFQASGAIEGIPSAPRGRITVDLDAHDLAGVSAVLATFAPTAVDPVLRLKDRLLPAKVHATLAVEGGSASGATTGTLALDGRMGAFRLSLAGEESGKIEAFPAARIRLDGKVETDDGSALTSLLGLDRFIAVDKRAGKLIILAKGATDGDLHVDGRIMAGGLDAAAGGTLRLLGDEGPTGTLNVAVASADARPLRRQVAGRVDPLPVTLSGLLALSPTAARIDVLSGKVAGASVRGSASATLGHPMRIDGAVETDALDASAALAAAVGLPAHGGTRSELAVWSTEPFGAWLFSDLIGSIAVKAAHATFTPALVAQNLQAVVRFGPSEFGIDDLSGTLAGGRLTSRLSVRSAPSGFAARGQMALSDADAALLFRGDGRSPVAGRFGLQIEAAGDGLSPGALIGSLTGGGTLTFDRAQLAGLSPKVFDTLTRAVDQGTVFDTPRVRDIVATAFDAGRLSVPRLEAAIAVNAGQARVATTLAPVDGAELAVNGNLDLSGGALDARLTLSGLAGPDMSGQRPDVLVSLKGPLPLPKRTLDVSALAGWLTLRAVEQQSQRLEAAEAKRREAEAAEAKRRQSALNPEQAASDSPASTAAIGEDARPLAAPTSQSLTGSSDGSANASEGRPAPVSSESAVGTHEAPPGQPAASNGWVSTVTPPSSAVPAVPAPLQAPIEVRPVPAPAQRKPASHAAAEAGPATPARPRAAPKRPALPGPLKLFSPSPSP